MLEGRHEQTAGASVMPEHLLVASPLLPFLLCRPCLRFMAVVVTVCHLVSGAQ